MARDYAQAARVKGQRHRIQMSLRQVANYARLKGMDVAEAERWLRPNLAYDG